MSLHASIRFAAVAGLMGVFSAVPAMAADDATAPAAAPAAAAPAHTGFHPIHALHRHWEKMKARHAFHHLSADGQYALVDILTAQQALADNKPDVATKSLKDASERLQAAGKAEGKFVAAESELHPAPQHPAAANHVAKTEPTTWIPVGGEFIASETLAPEKQAAVAKANAQLKAGQTADAVQTMQVVGADLDFIIALAPLDQTEGAVNRALVFTENKNTAEATSALNEALDALVFVSENYYATEVAAPAAPAKKKKAAAKAPAAAAPAATPAPAATTDAPAAN